MKQPAKKDLFHPLCSGLVSYGHLHMELSKAFPGPPKMAVF